MLKVAVIGVVVLATFVAGIAKPRPASAAELPAFSVETRFTGTSGTEVFETVSGTKITCRKSTMELTSATSRSGAFHFVDKECTSSSITCSGLGDTEGVLLMLGEWQFVERNEEHALLLLSINENHASCGGLVLVVVKGKVLAAITPIGESTKSYELGLKQSKGHQEIAEYETETGELVRDDILISTNEGAFSEAGEEAAEDKLTAAAATEIKVLPGSLRASTNPILFGRIQAGRTSELMISFTNVSLLTTAALAEPQVSNGVETVWFVVSEPTVCRSRLLMHNQRCEVLIRFAPLRRGTLYKSRLTIDGYITVPMEGEGT